MTTVVYVTLSMALLAFANVLLEQKLSGFNTLTLIICYSGVTFILALCLRQFYPIGPGIMAFPTGPALGATIIVALLFFVGDYFYIGAYTNGGSLFVIVVLTLTFPVFASLFRLFFVMELPNKWHLLAFACVAAGAFFAHKANGVHAS